jgi:hypothetical protein
VDQGGTRHRRDQLYMFTVMFAFDVVSPARSRRLPAC